MDSAARVGTSVALAIPNYWLAIELVVLFAVTWKLLPPSGYVKFTEDPVEWLRHIVLPAVALGVWSAASLARQLRASLIDALDSRYVRTAWAKGRARRRVVLKHAMKNAAIPVVTVLGLQIGFLLGGTVIIEQIFSIPGPRPVLHPRRSPARRARHPGRRDRVRPLHRRAQPARSTSATASSTRG